jgi:hypothetical protein
VLISELFKQKYLCVLEEMRNANRVLVGKPEWKRPRGKTRPRWEDNIRMDLTEVGWEGANWMNLVQDRDNWWTFVSEVMNPRFP